MKRQKLSLCQHLFAVFVLGLGALTTWGCSGSTPQPAASAATPAPVSNLPAFCADSALAFTAGLLDFGPRVPGTPAQRKAADWLESELTRHGCAVVRQEGVARAYDGTRLPIINLVGVINPEATTRVLVMAHWDSRHVADNDPNPALRDQPVMGANDGASGVGVMLELARLCAQQTPNVGLDLFLTDAEDYGPHETWEGRHEETHWALGTQQWCAAPHQPGYKAQYGILLDMVGAPDATFFREYYSDYYARPYVDRIWKKAAELGYTTLFINQRGGGITDDHVFVNRRMGIPTVDIIDTRPNDDQSFYPYWHTTADTLDKLSAATLGKVGRVLVALFF